MLSEKIYPGPRDIFMTNMTNRAVRQVGMTWEQVHEANPGIIGLYEPMQGLTGPHTEYMGFGAVLSALCGLNYQAGYAKNRPVGVGSNYPDYVVNPAHGIIAMMAALRHKRRTGEGQLIDMSQLESSAAVLSTSVFALDNAGLEYVRQGNRVHYAAPHGAYRTAEDAARPDQWIAIACLTDDQWQAAAGAMGQPEWATDARFASLAGRKANEDALDALVGGWAAAQQGRQAMGVLQAAGVPAGLVLNATEVLQDPHLTERGYYAYPDHAEAGRRAYDGPGFRLSRTPNEVRGAAPLLGEHTFEVATEILGIPAEEVGRLIAEDVLR
ncbi:MAG: CoA transferase, partial [Dehalococcoidia bacterium]